MIKKFVVGLIAIAIAGYTNAQVVASDDASQPAYHDQNGWDTTDNGGTGFLAWSTLTQTFIGSSGNIDTAGSSSFALFSNTFNTGGAEAIRPFGSDLAVGQTFTLDFDNGSVGSGGTVGFALLSGTTPRFEYFFVGGGNVYTVSGSTDQSTSHGFTADGMHTSLTLTGTDSFSFSITFNTGTPTTETFTGTLKGTAGSSINAVRFFDNNPNLGPAGSDAFYNSPAVVPEPSTLALLGGSFILAASFFLRRRRKS